MRTKILFLSMLLLTSVATAFAETTWSLSSDNKTLTISGTGDMPDYAEGNFPPWYPQRLFITTVMIEGGVTSIGDFAFAECSSLTSVNIPEGVTSIGYYAFSECAFASITLPGSVTSIWWKAFNKCRILSSIVIPDGVTTIEDETFRFCSSLTSITLGNKVETIKDNAFEGCGRLTSIVFPASMKSIGSYAFFECKNLASVTIPAGVTNIGNWSFFKCLLTSVTNLNPTPQSIASGTFYAVDLSKATLYVPAESIEAYRAADYWKDFKFIEAYVPSVITEPAIENDIRIYPNPVTESFRISGLTAPAQVVVFDVSGKTVLRQTVQGEESISIGHLPKGVYPVRINNKTIKIVTSDK
jgi:hypothetical protein